MITQSIYVIKFYESIEEIEKASDTDIRPKAVLICSSKDTASGPAAAVRAWGEGMWQKMRLEM